MSYSNEVKEIAYKLDPECWISYACMTPIYKRRMDLRRTATLQAAQEAYDKVEQRKRTSLIDRLSEESSGLSENSATLETYNILCEIRHLCRARIHDATMLPGNPMKNAVALQVLQLLGEAKIGV